MFWIEVLRALAALALTVGLMVGLAWLARKYGLMQGMPAMGGQARRLKLVERLWVDPGRTQLLLVACDGREHLILVAPGGATEVARPASPGAASSDAHSAARPSLAESQP